MFYCSRQGERLLDCGPARSSAVSGGGIGLKGEQSDRRVRAGQRKDPSGLGVAGRVFLHPAYVFQNTTRESRSRPPRASAIRHARVLPV